MRGGKGKGVGRWVSSPAYRVVIETVVEERKKAGLTQRALADALKKQPSFVAKIEKRERRLDLVELVAIARALGVRENDMLRKIVAVLPKQIEI